MAIEEEITRQLMDGKSPTEIINSGYAKSTVYKVYSKERATNLQIPTREWNWAASAILNKARYLSEEAGFADLKLKNTGVTDLFVSQAGVQFDWLGNKWLSTPLKTMLNPGEEKALTRIFFTVPSNTPLGNHSYRIGINTHVWYPTGWINVGLIWSEDRPLEVKYLRRNYTVFIAHSVKNPTIVHSIARLLDNYGIQAFIAEREPQPGRGLSEKISRMLDSSDCLLAILTKEGANSEWVNQEIGYAKRAGNLVVPLVEKGVSVKGFIEGIEWIEFDPSNPAKALRDILQGIEPEALRKEQIIQKQQQQQTAANQFFSLIIFACLIVLLGAALSD